MSIRLKWMISLFGGILWMFFLTGCTAATQNPVAAPLAAQASPTIGNTLSPAPTKTAEPTATEVPTLTPLPGPTSLPTATASPTADPSMAQIKFLGLEWQPHYDMRISLQFPAAVDPANYRVTLEDEEYTCQTVAPYTDRLYCTGRGRSVFEYATIRVYPKGSGTPGFEKKVSIPFFNK